MTSPVRLMDALAVKFGDKVRANISLAPYTSARIGGLADVLVTANSADELSEIMTLIWKTHPRTM